MKRSFEYPATLVVWAETKNEADSVMRQSYLTPLDETIDNEMGIEFDLGVL